MRTRRDFLTPAIVIGGIIIVIFALWVVICDAQTHTMPGSNVVPSGASLTINSGASITAAAGSTVTGFGSGGTPAGSTGQLQFNNASAFGADSLLTWDNSAKMLTSRIKPRVTSTASATTWAPSADTDDVYEVTAQAAPVTTISNPSGTPVDGQSLIIRFKDNGTARALTWSGSQWEAGPNMGLPTTTVVGNHDYAGFKWNSTTSKWTMVASTQDGLTSGTSILKGNGSGGFSNAASGTDYAPATSGSSILYGNGSGGFSNVTVGTGLSFTTGTLTSTVTASSGANPTAKVGTSAVNGSASTFMRSDGSPPIDQTIDLGMTAGQTISVSNATTNAVDDLFTISHNSSGAAATGFGTGVLFRAEDDTSNNQNQSEIQTAWTTATHGSRTAAVTFLVEGNAAANLAGEMKLFGSASGSGGLSVGQSLTNPGQSGIINAEIGYKVAGASATAGKILQGGGSVFTASTPTWPTAAGAAGYTIRSNATNFTSYPAQLVNSSVSAQSPSTADVYLTGSNIVVTAGDFQAKGQYKCVFDMTKSAGTGAIVITLRVGTTGSTSDAAIQTYTFGAGTSVADTGIFEVIATWRTVGSGTSAVIQGICRGTHQLATTGLFNNAAGWVLIGSPSPSSGFASNTATNIGISFNGSTAFAGTAQIVQAQLQQ